MSWRVQLREFLYSLATPPLWFQLAVIVPLSPLFFVVFCFSVCPIFVTLAGLFLIGSYAALISFGIYSTRDVLVIGAYLYGILSFAGLSGVFEAFFEKPKKAKPACPTGIGGQ